MHACPYLLQRPVGQRVVRLQTKDRIKLCFGQLGTGQRLFAPLACDPCRTSLQDAPQRLHLAQAATGLAQLNTFIESKGAMFIDMPLDRDRSEEHTSELQSLMRISYAVFCLTKKKKTKRKKHT